MKKLNIISTILVGLLFASSSFAIGGAGSGSAGTGSSGLSSGAGAAGSSGLSAGSASHHSGSATGSGAQINPNPPGVNPATQNPITGPCAAGDTSCKAAPSTVPSESDR